MEAGKAPWVKFGGGPLGVGTSGRRLFPLLGGRRRRARHGLLLLFLLLLRVLALLFLILPLAAGAGARVT